MASSFDEVAKHYTRRIPYLRMFFRHAAEALALGENARLLDLACGTGELAAGFSGHCREVVAIDRSAEMLAVARENLPANVRVEQADLNRPLELAIGKFDGVVVGRALRLFERESLTSLLDDVLAPSGSLLVCSTALDYRTPWGEAYLAIARSVLDDLSPRGRDWQSRFEGWSYEYRRSFACVGRRRFSPDALMGNLLSYTSASARLAADFPAYRRQLEDVLRPYYSEDGKVTAFITSKGSLYGKG